MHTPSLGAQVWNTHAFPLSFEGLEHVEVLAGINCWRSARLGTGKGEHLVVALGGAGC